MNSTRSHSRRASDRRGVVLIYSIYIMMVMCALISVAVDYGRCQIIKTEEQRAADNIARGILVMYLNKGPSYGYTPKLAAQSQYAHIADASLETGNPVDGISGVAPTYVIRIGSWYGSPAATFHNADFSGPLSVQVTISRSVTNGNPVRLAFPLPSGKTFVTQTCDVWATATAVLPDTVTLLSGGTVSPNGDPWLAGLPAGGSGSASYDDTVASGAAQNQSPISYTVIPGSTLTFTNVSGHVMHMPDGTVTTDGDGPTGGSTYWHMKDPPVGGVPQGMGNQNGIADLTAPIDSLIGVFLNGVAPNDPANTSVANPTARDFSQDIDNSGVVDLKIQQPFYIGDGKNSSNVTQTFVVPATASRFYMGIMDGYEWANNVGSFQVQTVSEQPPIYMAQ